MAIREPFNAISHLVGAVVFGVGALVLLAISGHPAFFVYAVGAVGLFTCSTVYHWRKIGKWPQRFDHAAIYAMIAGCYTPISLLALPTPHKWIVLGLQWSMAAIGIIVSLSRDKTPTWLRLVLYLGMGWMILPILGTALPGLGSAGVAWMVAGGLAYSLGVVVYASKRPNPWPGKFGHHEIWHLFVLAGAACHFVAIAFLAQPR